jgi:calcineurin-like phosphoesterase family protein
MSKTWVCADHHFGHPNIIKFLRDDGSKLRPFNTIEEHDETIIQNHNSLVKPEDRVYLLGDCCITRRSVHTLGRLNGRLVLVKGNHDIFKLKEYEPYVDDIRAYVVQKSQDGHKVIMSHIPIHADSLDRWGCQIHGHTHYRSVDDPRYVCASLEHTNYFPIEVHEALKIRDAQLRRIK